MVDLAKPGLDVGLYTNLGLESLAFYGDELGLASEGVLKVGGGVHQHRLSLRGSVLKINDSRPALGRDVTGYRRLRIADETVPDATLLVDPNGVEVELVPPGTAGVDAIGVVVEGPDLAAMAWFWSEALGATPLAADRFRLGSTVIECRPRDGWVRPGPMAAAGFRYLTVQVRDVRADHARLVDLGVEEGAAPMRLGSVARISFIRDPAGNWIELSQRASLVGDLGPDDA